MRTIDWNRHREYLYEELVARFGPHAKWETTIRPGRGLDAEYAKFKKNFAATFGAKSHAAVQQQISWSLLGTRHLKRSHVVNWVTNSAAAYKAGFISFGDFPQEMLLGDGKEQPC